MLLALLSDTHPQGSEIYSLKFCLKCPSGETIPFVFEYSDELLSKMLFSKVEQVTGIPQDLQMLSYKSHLINPDTPLREYRLEDNSSINLSVKGVGGGGENDSKGISNNGKGTL